MRSNPRATPHRPIPSLASLVTLASPVALAAQITVLGACGGSPGGEADPRREQRDAADAASGRAILVSAAASLTDVFTDIESAFEAAHPDVDVTLNLAGSSRLAMQILQGAPADVFASADLANMERVAGAGEVAGQPRVFARNALHIAVAPGNPGGVRSLRDFGRDELLLGLCAEGVPCGDLAREALALAGVTATLDTEEPDVRALLTKVELGELDAGITYMTDVAAVGDAVRGIDIPAHENLATEYAIAALGGASSPEVARAFVAFVLSPEGQQILARHGFGSP